MDFSNVKLINVQKLTIFQLYNLHCSETIVPTIHIYHTQTNRKWYKMFQIYVLDSFEIQPERFRPFQFV